MSRLAVVIDQASCWGCKACEVACKQENQVPGGVKLIHVGDNTPKKINGKLEFSFQVNTCTQCEAAPCIDDCPFAAITRRPDGIVVLDGDNCTGCRLCIDACPTDAIHYDQSQNLARKCNMCHHRVDQGLIPACADNICLARCIYFGDPEEINRQIEAKWQSRTG
jgi:Fe-S-cluster-containing dehydrogenase component